MYVEEYAIQAINFIQCLKHTKGRWAGKPFILLKWQRVLIKKLFGTVDEDGNRIYRKCYAEIPKKNGKSELAAAIALYLLTLDGEIGAEIYSAAADKKQAGIVFQVAAEMVRQSEYLSKICRIIDSQKRIVYYKTNSFYEVLSSDVKTKHGFNAHGVIFDELHAQPNRDLWDVLTEGSGIAREQPLIFVITTAGFDRKSICWEIHQYAEKVISGAIKDKHFLAMLYGLDVKENYQDEKNWHKANPSLGTKEEIKAGTKILDIERFRDDFNEAKNKPAAVNNWRRLRLNQWTTQETEWLPFEAWKRCGGTVNSKELLGYKCYAGLDLSSSDDITAFVLVFNIDEVHKVLPFFFIPKENIEKRVRKDNVPYDLWIQQGYIFATEGNVIDYNFIEEKIYEIAKLYDIEEIAIDPYNALMLNQKLSESGLRTVEIRQGMKSLSPPTKECERWILSRTLNHGDNPVLTWMFSNVMIISDLNDNRRVDKEKSKEKIDGIQALIMAISRAALYTDSTKSVYDTRDILVI